MRTNSTVYNGCAVDMTVGTCLQDKIQLSLSVYSKMIVIKIILETHVQDELHCE